MIFNEYPYTNFHELNDDWIIKTLREFGQRLNEFVAANSLTYADPITYDPATAYPANTVVIDNGIAYVSKQPVPAGMLPADAGDYWLAIFPFGDLIEQVMSESMAVVMERVDAYLDTVNDQIAQIEADAEAAINNIPANVNAWMDVHPDVTTTVQNGSISFPKLLSALKYVILAGYEESANSTVIANSEFEQGSITQSGDSPASNACRTGYMQFGTGILQIRAANGYHATVFSYTKAGVTRGVPLSGINTEFNAFSVKESYKYRFVIMRNDSADFTPADLPEQALWYYTETPVYANQIGRYPHMTVGDAEQLLSSERIIDKVPYNVRIAGDGRGDIGNHVEEYIVGGSIRWNQLASLNPDDWNKQRASMSVNLNTITVTATSSTSLKFIQKPLVNGHKYMIRGKLTAGNSDALYGIYSGTSTSYDWRVVVSAGDTDEFERVIVVPNDNMGLRLGLATAAAVGDELTIEKLCIFDLTDMFKSDIADHVYNLEQTTPGSGCAWFDKLFPNDYYSPDNELYSVSTSKHITVGFNQFDIDNPNSIAGYFGTSSISSSSSRLVVYIPCLPNTQYTVSRSRVASNDRFAVAYAYDVPAVGVSIYGKTSAPNAGVVGEKMILHCTTDSNAKYLAVWAYYNDTAEALDDLNISFTLSGYRDGDFEPYDRHVYALATPLTLRGIPKLDSAGNLYYDGDMYGSDGKITRYYAERAYQSGDESLPDTMTDGVNTVYKLSTPEVTYVASYINPQVVSNFGAEEYVDYGVEQSDRDVAVPVGHVSVYHLNLRDKLENMPALPDTDGAYVLLRQDGEYSYVLIEDLNI